MEIHVNGDARKFTNKPFDNQKTYYRIKAITAAGVTYYSNIVSLKGVTGRGKFSIAGNFISNELVVLSDNAYQYKIADISGKTIASGTLSNGTTRINLNNAARGMYFIQVQSADEKWTEKFIKQ